MTKDELYNKLLQQVQGEGGYIAFDKGNHPVVEANGGKYIDIAAVFEGADNTHPLRLVEIVGDNCCSWNLYDYISAFGIIEIIETYNKQL